MIENVGILIAIISTGLVAYNQGRRIGMTEGYSRATLAAVDEIQKIEAARYNAGWADCIENLADQVFSQNNNMR